MTREGFSDEVVRIHDYVHTFCRMIGPVAPSKREEKEKVVTDRTEVLFCPTNQHTSTLELLDLANQTLTNIADAAVLYPNRPLTLLELYLPPKVKDR